MTEPFRGFYAIALTPFDETGALLWDELEREFDWIARAGAHGLVWPVNNSEFYCLSEAERARGFELAARTLDGRIPFVAGVHDTSKATAVDLSEAAAKAGVDAIIAMPPWAIKMTSEALVADFYRDVAAAAGVPVFIQNLGGWVGSSLSSQQIVDLCREIDGVCYVKEERDPHGVWVSEVIAANDGSVAGVFTGGHKLGMVSTHRRGAAGCIASADMSDICGRIWDLMEAGDEAGARVVQDAEAIMHKACLDLGGLAGRKEILVRRGVFTSNSQRSVGPVAYDASYLAEFDHAWSVLEPHFRI